MVSLVPDPDLEIRGGGGERSSRPLDKGGPGLPKNFFRPFGPQFGPKLRGGAAPPGPTPGSATEVGKFCIQLSRERLSEKVHATIPKGITGGFEFSFLRRNLKQWHEKPWTYVC